MTVRLKSLFEEYKANFLGGLRDTNLLWGGLEVYPLRSVAEVGLGQDGANYPRGPTARGGVPHPLYYPHPIYDP